MILYLLRHAIALDRSRWKRPDSERPLTPEGIRKMRKSAKGLKQLDLGVDWILTSPYARAYATAKIAAEALKARKKLKTVDALVSEADPRLFVKYLSQTYAADDVIMAVGHEPHLSRLVSVLIGGQGTLALEFKKGGLCKLTVDALHYGRCATLDWWLPPKLLKRLA